MNLNSTLIRAKQAITSAIASLERNPQTKLHLQQLKTASKELDACLAEVPLDPPPADHPELPLAGPGPDEKGPLGAEGTRGEPLTMPEGVQTDQVAPGGSAAAAAAEEDAAADSEQGDPPSAKKAAPKKTFTEKVTDLVTKKKAAPAKKAAKKK